MRCSSQASPPSGPVRSNYHCTFPECDHPRLGILSNYLFFVQSLASLQLTQFQESIYSVSRIHLPILSRNILTMSLQGWICGLWMQSSYRLAWIDTLIFQLYTVSWHYSRDPLGESHSDSLYLWSHTHFGNYLMTTDEERHKELGFFINHSTFQDQIPKLAQYFKLYFFVLIIFQILNNTWSSYIRFSWPSCWEEQE